MVGATGTLKRINVVASARVRANMWYGDENTVSRRNKGIWPMKLTFKRQKTVECERGQTR